MKIGVFMDVSNLYYCVKNRFNDRKLNYQRYLDFIKGLGHIEIATAYGAHRNNGAQRFIECLEQAGYTAKFKEPKIVDGADRRKADWDIGIVLDIIQVMDQLDMIVLGSADGDFEPVVEYLLEHGKKVVILASGISIHTGSIATQSIEIPESLLEDLKR